MDLATAKKIVNKLVRESAEASIERKKSDVDQGLKPAHRKWDMPVNISSSLNNKDDLFEALIIVCRNFETRLSALEQ
jgi:hypothetical protein